MITGGFSWIQRGFRKHKLIVICIPVTVFIVISFISIFLNECKLETERERRPLVTASSGSFSIIENESIGLVFAKTWSINSGTGEGVGRPKIYDREQAWIFGMRPIRSREERVGLN